MILLEVDGREDKLNKEDKFYYYESYLLMWRILIDVEDKLY